MRIVSLLPSTTEIVFALGAGDELVGVTFECDFPAEARDRRVVSTTALPEGLTPAEIDAEVRARIAAGEDLYRLDQGALSEIQPELVLTQDLCAVCAVDVTDVDAALAHLGCNGTVLTVDPARLEDVVASVGTVARAIGRPEAGGALEASLHRRLARVADAVAGRPRPRVAVLEWTDPPFSAGHWVPDMVQAAGCQPATGAAGERSVTIAWDDVADAHPDHVVVAPCGYRLPGAMDLAEELVATERLPAGVPVWAVDADACFVRPGPRVVDGVEALAGALHPGTIPAQPEVVTRVR